jgi:hypothetical protein
LKIQEKVDNSWQIKKIQEKVDNLLLYLFICQELSTSSCIYLFLKSCLPSLVFIYLSRVVYLLLYLFICQVVYLLLYFFYLPWVVYLLLYFHILFICLILLTQYYIILLSFALDVKHRVTHMWPVLGFFPDLLCYDIAVKGSKFGMWL